MSLFRTKNIRKEIISSYEVGKMGLIILPLRTFQRKLLDYLWYAHKYPSRGSRRTPMDIEEAVTKWVNTIAGITLSHTKDELDKWEFTLNDILTPILTAPVAQLREFYKKLLVALEADQRIPFVVWGLFNKWGEHILTKTDDADFAVRGVRTNGWERKCSVSDIYDELRNELEHTIFDLEQTTKKMRALNEVIQETEEHMRMLGLVRCPACQRTRDMKVPLCSNGDNSLLGKIIEANTYDMRRYDWVDCETCDGNGFYRPTIET